MFKYNRLENDYEMIEILAFRKKICIEQESLL